MTRPFAILQNAQRPVVVIGDDQRVRPVLNQARRRFAQRGLRRAGDLETCQVSLRLFDLIHIFMPFHPIAHPCPDAPGQGFRLSFDPG